MYNVRAPRDFLPLFQHKKMRFPPGEKFEYNDGGFIILGLIIEQQTGTSFSEYIEENILAPCGMEDSGYFAADRLPGRTAYSYIQDEADNSWRTNVFAVPVVGGPDGGAYTTAPDMVKFWMALFDGRILNVKHTEKLLYPHIAAKTGGEHRYYGYGVWMIKPADAVSAYYVEGWDPGVAFISSFHPKNELMIMIIGNTNRPAWPIHDGIVSGVVCK